VNGVVYRIEKNSQGSIVATPIFQAPAREGTNNEYLSTGAVALPPNGRLIIGDTITAGGSRTFDLGSHQFQFTVDADHSCQVSVRASQVSKDAVQNLLDSDFPLSTLSPRPYADQQSWNTFYEVSHVGDCGAPEILITAFVPPEQSMQMVHCEDTDPGTGLPCEIVTSGVYPLGTADPIRGSPKSPSTFFIVRANAAQQATVCGPSSPFKPGQVVTAPFDQSKIDSAIAAARKNPFNSTANITLKFKLTTGTCQKGPFVSDEPDFATRLSGAILSIMTYPDLVPLDLAGQGGTNYSLARVDSTKTHTLNIDNPVGPGLQVWSVSSLSGTFQTFLVFVFYQ
jgi:hypothetical protein